MHQRGSCLSRPRKYRCTMTTVRTTLNVCTSLRKLILHGRQPEGMQLQCTAAPYMIRLLTVYLKTLEGSIKCAYIVHLKGSVCTHLSLWFISASLPQVYNSRTGNTSIAISWTITIGLWSANARKYVDPCSSVCANTYVQGRVDNSMLLLCVLRYNICL